MKTTQHHTGEASRSFVGPASQKQDAQVEQSWEAGPPDAPAGMNIQLGYRLDELLFLARRLVEKIDGMEAAREFQIEVDISPQVGLQVNFDDGPIPLGRVILLLQNSGFVVSSDTVINDLENAPPVHFSLETTEQAIVWTGELGERLRRLYRIWNYDEIDLAARARFRRLGWGSGQW